MHTPTVLVAALAAAVSVVSAAEAPRPRIYFPRQVKRQFFNSSMTTDSPSSQSTPFDAAPETTKRDTLSISDLLASLTTNPTFTDKPKTFTTSFDASSSPDSTDSTFSSLFGDSNSGSSDPGSSGSPGSVTTVVIQSTIIVPPSTDPTPSSDAPVAAGSTGGIPASIVQPTTADVSTPVSASPTESVADSPSASVDPATEPTTAIVSSAKPTEDPSSSTGILLAPTGIVTSATEQPTAEPSTETPSPTLIDPLAPISSILNSVVSEVTSAILPSPNVTETAEPPVTTTPLSEESTSPPAEPTVEPTVTAAPTDPSPSTSPTTPETEQPSVTLDPTTGPPEPTSSTGLEISIPLTILPGPSTVDESTPTVTEEPTTSPTDIIDPLPTVTNGTDPSPTSTPPTTLEPTITDEPTGPTQPPTTILEPTTPPSSGNDTNTEPPVSTPTVTSVPGTDITAAPTSEPTLLPTVIPGQPNITSTDNTTTPETSAPPPPVSTTSLPLSSVAAPSSPSSVSEVTSIAATATLTGAATNTYLPTTIIVDQPPTATPSKLAPTGTASSMPSFLPQAITPDAGNGGMPPGTVLIGISFLHSLNYEFVSDTPFAAAQIFSNLPPIVADTGDFPNEKVMLKKLMPLNTERTLGYYTTVAVMTYPESFVDELAMMVKTPSSQFYNMGNAIQRNLTREVNSAIDIRAFQNYQDGAAGSGSGSDSPGATASGGAGGDPFGNTGKEGGNGGGRPGMTVGIAFGALSVAGAYGAAMFIIARRYKRKKLAHRRASSMTNPSEMTQSAPGTPHLMNGALLSRDFSSYGGVAGGRDSHGTQNSGRSGAKDSARTAYISGPMAAENSLGWN
ncbi:hypothetical protein GE09DRAFT_655943 [Coniochaeta sp. 2T2.1]|nr:hypothetical protein GE09DRAFT_655943 [Coniochaeta sp. 2T2.1]